MTKWQNFYTSYELSQHIKETKGMFPPDHQYWNSPCAFLWINEKLKNYSLYWSQVHALGLYNHVTYDWSVGAFLKKHPNIIPAYHILQDIVLQNPFLFLKDNYLRKEIINNFSNIGTMATKEDEIKAILSTDRLDNEWI